jgi:hypothetical protein
MPRVPDTKASLILRLPSADDAEAWREFVFDQLAATSGSSEQHLRLEYRRELFRGALDRVESEHSACRFEVAEF